MRVSPKQGSPEVSPMPNANSGRVRMHIAGVTYRMEPNEALDLAYQLVNAVDKLKEIDEKGEQRVCSEN